MFLAYYDKSSEAIASGNPRYYAAVQEMVNDMNMGAAAGAIRTACVHHVAKKDSAFPT
jgi:hypothetical protein